MQGRMRRLLEGMGSPHSAWPAVHVAGTKGKGSTTALLASILQASQYRVGTYTRS
jgi:folylpolyglutamate synthase/dihydropteroate synthase